MGAVLCLRANVGIMMYFSAKELGSGLDYVADFAALAVLFALVCLLCSLLVGSAFNAKRDGKAYCPLWKLLLSIFCVAAGVAIALCFFYLLATKHVGAAELARFRTADIIFMLSGVAFVLSGIVGISRWRHVRGKIAVERAEAKAAAKAQEEKAAREKAEKAAHEAQTAQAAQAATLAAQEAQPSAPEAAASEAPAGEPAQAPQPEAPQDGGNA